MDGAAFQLAVGLGGLLHGHGFMRAQAKPALGQQGDRLAGQFSDAAADLSITQQAVSKRIAALEKDLGVRLFTRTPRGAELTIDGQTFLPHARDLLQAAERAAASVRPGRRALRVDVIAGGSRRRPCCATSTRRIRRPNSTS